MGQTNNSVGRPPCRNIPPSQIGSYLALGQLVSGSRSEAFVCQETGSSTELVLVRRLLGGHDPKAFERDIARTRSLSSKFVRATGIEIDGTSCAITRPFVSEPLSLLLQTASDGSTGIPLPVAVSIAHGILLRLHETETKGLHSDLVPHHILIGFDGSIEIIDPAGPEDGIARAQLVNRRAHRSPEHLQNSGLTAASDIFVVGILLYEMSTGQLMFDGDSESQDRQIRAGKYRRPRSVVGRSYPIELQVVLRKMLSAEIGPRFESAQNALDGLDLVAGPQKTHHARLIQSYMHKTFPEHYSAWRAIFTEGGVTLPPPEVTQTSEPDEARHRGETESSVAGIDAEAGSVSDASPWSESDEQPLRAQSRTDIETVPPTDDGLMIREEPTHVTDVPAISQTAKPEQASTRLPPLPTISPNKTQPQIEKTSPHISPPVISLAEVVVPLLAGEIEPTPTPILPPSQHLPPPEAIAERAEKRHSHEDKDPTDDSAENEEDVLHDQSLAPPVTQPETALEALIPLLEVPERTATLADPNSRPVSAEHLSLAADLLDANTATDRSSNPQSGIAIPVPRKLTPRAESDWSQTLAEAESSGRIQVPDAPVRPRPLERLTRDSIVGGKLGEQSSSNSPSGLADLELQSTPDEQTPISPSPAPDFDRAPISPAVLPDPDSELLDDSMSSDSLVLPVSDTALDKEYLRQKRLVHIGFTGIGLLLLVITFLVFQIIADPDPSSDHTQEVLAKDEIRPSQTAEKQKQLAPPLLVGPNKTASPSSPTALATPSESATASAALPAQDSLPIKPAPFTSTKISVQAFPLSKATIFLDGKEIPNGSEIKITEGGVELEIKALGYQTYKERLKPGRTEAVEVLLSRRR